MLWIFIITLFDFLPNLVFPCSVFMGLDLIAFCLWNIYMYFLLFALALSLTALEAIIF